MENALSHITILDFSHLLQGPFATQLLGDLGANIIKIERPGKGDLFRSMTFFNQWVGGSESPNFLAWNRNKRSLALDLKHPDAKAAIYKMAEQADVVVQNFRPGVMARLGYGYEDFQRINPRIIYCSGSGYGEDGPYVTRPGQDMLIQGLSGLMSATGQADGPPMPVGAGFADQIGAMNMVYGILSSLLWREKSGKGQEVKVNLLAGLMAHQMQEYVAAMNFERDFERPNSGIGHPGMDAPFGVYPSSDGWVTIAMSPFKTLVEALEAPHLAEYDDPSILFDRRDEIWAEIARETAKYPTEELMRRLLALDVWCGEVRTHREAAEDPQVKHIGAITSYRHPTAGSVKTVAPAVGFSETPAQIARPAPLVGEHSREVLSECGFDNAEIERLLKSGAVAQHSDPDDGSDG